MKLFSKSSTLRDLPARANTSLASVAIALSVCAVLAPFTAHAQSANTGATNTGISAEIAPALPPSSVARRLYEARKDSLVQVRVLVTGTESQASSGSGFFVSPDGLIVTNYHVVSQLVLEPERYRAEFVRTDNLRGSITVLAIDVQHDLAVVRATSPAPGNAWATMTLAPEDSLRQGDKVFSMGNPLDLGFAISEGTYNGKPERALYPQLLFTGAMNPGVSGGPAIDEQGRVVGVNVAGLGRAAELTNFQVPIRFVREIIARASTRKSTTAETHKSEMRAQLIAHQNAMLDQMHGGQWKTQPLGNYRVPVIPDTLARCWGNASAAEKKNYRYETASCSLAGELYIDNSLRIGSVSTQHEVSSTKTLGALRFANLRSKSFANERGIAGGQNKHRTASRCNEDFIKSDNLSYRAVTCVRAYRKFESLYDISTVVVSLDAALEGLESSIFLSGVDYERGLQESRRFIAAISRVKS